MMKHIITSWYYHNARWEWCWKKMEKNYIYKIINDISEKKEKKRRDKRCFVRLDVRGEMSGVEESVRD